MEALLDHKILEVTPQGIVRVEILHNGNIIEVQLIKDGDRYPSLIDDIELYIRGFIPFKSEIARIAAETAALEAIALEERIKLTESLSGSTTGIVGQPQPTTSGLNSI